MNFALRGIRVASLLVILACTAVAGGAAAQSPNGEIYTHPSRGYSVTIPDKAQIRHPEGNVDIAIDSDKGFGVILQSADAGPNTSISELAAILEAAYLGPDKAWERKVGQEISLVSGLVAFNGYYEGGGASYRVVITRGQDSTYTFVFRSRTDAFNDLATDFDEILLNFRPSPGDLPAAPAPAISQKTTSPESANREEESETAALPQAQHPVETGPAIPKFNEPSLGYSVEFDPGWILERPSSDAVMFSGPEGTDSFYATVSIQNVAPPSAETAVQAASLIMDEIRAQFEKDASGVVFEREAPYVFRKDDVLLLGREFVVDYVLNDERFRQWTVVVPRPEGRVAYIWSYRAPSRSFQQYLPVARDMLSSWAITKRANDENASR